MLPTRFWEKVVIANPDECWTWTAANNAGYGVFYWHGRTQPAHRVAYEDAVGPVPDGLKMDHLCRNPACVNPAHLEPVTIAENTRRGTLDRSAAGRIAGLIRGAQQAAKTHCPFGHEYTPGNIKPGRGRKCRECHRERNRDYQRRRRAK